MTTESQHVVEQLSKLIGYTIEQVTLGDAGFPAILVRRHSQAKVLRGDDPDLQTKVADGASEGGTVSRYWIDLQSDAEGNGPGWANVEEVK